MFILYDIIFSVLAVMYLPYLVCSGKWHGEFWTRMGLRPLPVSPAQEKKIIWVHAVSVGEILAVVPLVHGLRERFPGHGLVVSTVTRTGYALAREKLQTTCTVIYAPVDFSWAVRRYIRTLKPVLYISAETEIWPNLYMFLHRNRVPIIQVNGRISDRAFAGYRKVGFLTRRVLTCVSGFYMQTEEDAGRIVRLGAIPQRVHVIGNLKFDQAPRQASLDKRQLGFDDAVQLLVAGSTYPGEEEIILAAFKQLSGEFPALRLIIAPRRAERAEEIFRLVQTKGFQPRRFSSLPQGREEGRNILIVDRFGYLRDIYGLADCVFVGKSLRGRGGQNMIEPLSFGKPTFVGPHTENFRDVVRIFEKTGALIRVEDGPGLIAQIRRVLADPSRLPVIAAAAIEEIRRHQGATRRTLEAIGDILRP
ncbi:MAG: 3-deoxy-D-manno-octulosonic acid transferase [Candidatus Omnitrophica bacterium]|nr:3-deoxy-D-manno-octulosonic acid transferase [Candidatus Omnitrophota bacterium]